jgi:hypothetical protein
MLRLALAAYLSFIALGARAATELPAITVTGEIKPPDIVMRDREQRSPDIHWPTTLSIRWSEVFAHNGIVINASCATVWNRGHYPEIVHAGHDRWLRELKRVSENPG